MSCEDAWNQVRELADRAAKAHLEYAALVKALPLMPETSLDIAEEQFRCNQADRALGRALQAAIRARRQH